MVRFIAGKSVGFVTVTRVTDATPSGLYANVADRGWEGDHYTQNIQGGCKDIASQLIDDYPEIQVRKMFQGMVQTHCIWNGYLER